MHMCIFQGHSEHLLHHAPVLEASRAGRAYRQQATRPQLQQQTFCIETLMMLQQVVCPRLQAERCMHGAVTALACMGAASAHCQISCCQHAGRLQIHRGCTEAGIRSSLMPVSIFGDMPRASANMLGRLSGLITL